jgi:hypothetical protein
VDDLGQLTGTEMAGQVLSALEASRAVIADVRLSVHVALDCWSMFGVGGFVERAGTLGFGSELPSQPASAESQSCQGRR